MVAAKPLAKSAKRYELCVYAVGSSYSETVCVSQETFEGTPRMMRHRCEELATQGPVKAFEYWRDELNSIPCETVRYTPPPAVDEVDPLPIAQKAFPNWRGRKVELLRRSQVSLSGTFWDGGSKSEYRAVELATGRTSDADQGLKTPAAFGGTGGLNQQVTIPPGFAIVEHVIFRGKELKCRVFLAPKPELAAAAESVQLDAGVCDELCGPLCPRCGDGGKASAELYAQLRTPSACVECSGTGCEDCTAPRDDGHDRSSPVIEGE